MLSRKARALRPEMRASMIVQSRDSARQFFFKVWRKMATAQPLEPLEAIVADVIRAHAHYHDCLADPARVLRRNFGSDADEDNPFLHMGLHVAIHEQLLADRPPGIRALYRQLQAGEPADPHALEHRMMACLSESLEQANRDGRMPDEATYLSALRRLG